VLGSLAEKLCRASAFLGTRVPRGIKRAPSSERGNALARTARRTERTSGLCGKAAPFAGRSPEPGASRALVLPPNPRGRPLRQACGRRVFPSLHLLFATNEVCGIGPRRGLVRRKTSRAFPPAGFGPGKGLVNQDALRKAYVEGEGVEGFVPFRRSTRNRYSRAVGARTSPRMQKSAERSRAQRSARSAVDGSEAWSPFPSACEREPALERKRIERKGERFFESRRSSSYERRYEKNATRVTLGLRAGAGSRAATVGGRDSRSQTRMSFTRHRGNGLGVLQVSTLERATRVSEALRGRLRPREDNAPDPIASSAEAGSAP